MKMKAKKFPSYLPSGLGVSKTGRLQVPFAASSRDKILNSYGQPMAQVGDLIAAVSHTGRISKNNLGKLKDIKYIASYPDPYIEIELTDGTIKKGGWLYGVYVMNPNEYSDALNFLK